MLLHVYVMPISDTAEELCPCTEFNNKLFTRVFVMFTAVINNHWHHVPSLAMSSTMSARRVMLQHMFVCTAEQGTKTDMHI